MRSGPKLPLKMTVPSPAVLRGLYLHQWTREHAANQNGPCVTEQPGDGRGTPAPALSPGAAGFAERVAACRPHPMALSGPGHTPRRRTQPRGGRAARGELVPVPGARLRGAPRGSSSPAFSQPGVRPTATSLSRWRAGAAWPPSRSSARRGAWCPGRLASFQASCSGAWPPGPE